MVDSVAVAIDRRDLRRTRMVERVLDQGGGIIMAVDHFALTANNVTYAAFGDRMHYWDFFPLDGDWGLVPVWGFGTVVRTDVPGIEIGDRFYGYFPMASHVHMVPGEVTEGSFLDLAANRAALTAGYNQYLKVGADPLYRGCSEEVQMLFRPLFLTAYAIDAYLFDNNDFGIRRVLVSSASSKTSCATAFLLARREAVEVIGLTSALNVAYVERLGLYDKALAYEGIEALAPAGATAYVDMAGDGDLRRRVHDRFDDLLKASCAVGATHWEGMAEPGVVLRGPKPIRFYVPGAISERVTAIGPAAFRAAYAAAWNDFIAHVEAPSAPWTVERGEGAREVQAAWLDLVDAGGAAGASHVLTMRA